VSSPRRIGLPTTLRMRHDPHYVEQLARPQGTPVGRLIPMEDIEPNPNQPRHSMGDLSELIASIREKGILEPILVRPADHRFEIVAGERRYRAALERQRFVGRLAAALWLPFVISLMRFGFRWRIRDAGRRRSEYAKILEDRRPLLVVANHLTDLLAFVDAVRERAA